jgi:hypothetical protein
MVRKAFSVFTVPLPQVAFDQIRVIQQKMESTTMVEQCARISSYTLVVPQNTNWGKHIGHC